MKRSRLNPVSARRRKRDAAYPAARMAVFERAGGRCEACAMGWAPDCNGKAEVVHHIAGRGGADPHAIDNLLAMSDAHHRHAHANPAEARELGLMRSRLSKGDAA